MGVALSACTVPHAGKPSFDLGENEIEIGIGIHGEPRDTRLHHGSTNRERRAADHHFLIRANAAACGVRPQSEVADFGTVRGAGLLFALVWLAGRQRVSGLFLA